MPIIKLFDFFSEFSPLDFCLTNACGLRGRRRKAITNFVCSYILYLDSVATKMWENSIIWYDSFHNCSKIISNFDFLSLIFLRCFIFHTFSHISILPEFSLAWNHFSSLPSEQWLSFLLSFNFRNRIYIARAIPASMVMRTVLVPSFIIPQGLATYSFSASGTSVSSGPIILLSLCSEERVFTPIYFLS